MVRAWRKSTSLARLCGRPFSGAAAVRGAQRLQNAALEGMPLAHDCYRTWKVAEMGSVWWCSSTGSITTGCLPQWRGGSRTGGFSGSSGDI
jgi:hypothetical protein